MAWKRRRGRADHSPASSIATAGSSSPPRSSRELRRGDARRGPRGRRARCSPGRVAPVATSARGSAVARRVMQLDDPRRRALGGLGPDRQRPRPEARALRPVPLVRPEPQAMWAPARGDWDAGRDLRSRLRRGRRRALGPHRPVPRELGAGAERGPLPRLADAVPPPRLLPRHGAAMGLDARAARRRTPTCSTCSATPASAAWC